MRHAALYGRWARICHVPRASLNALVLYARDAPDPLSFVPSTYQVRHFPLTFFWTTNCTFPAPGYALVARDSEPEAECAVPAFTLTGKVGFVNDASAAGRSSLQNPPGNFFAVLPRAHVQTSHSPAPPHQSKMLTHAPSD